MSDTAAAQLLAEAQAFLIDLDGTLVDSSGPVERVWAAFAHRHGLDPDQVHAFAQGRPSRETIRLLIGDGDEARRESQTVEHAEVTDTDGVRALPGAEAVLTGCKPVAIVTSCSTALARSRLRAADLPIPEALISSDGLERGKPDPAGFLLAAQRLGVSPQRCVVLEDSPTGIEAGRGAGAIVIALRTTHAEHELREADAIVDDLSAICRFVTGPPRSAS